MTNLTAKNSAELLTALKKAVAGDAILLGPGSYSDVSIKNIDTKGEVSIRPAVGAKVVFNDLNVQSSKGLSFSGIEMKVDPTNARSTFQILNSSNVKLDKLDMHGTMNGSAADDANGLLIRNSTNVAVTNSTFQQLANGITHADSDYVTLSGNRFTGLRVDGVSGGGTSHLTISANYFTNSDHSGDLHPDAIQVWTTNTKTSATDIVIKDNVIDKGQGYAFQGIFVVDNVGNLPYQRLTITGNTVIGANYQGISVSGARDVMVSDNTVISTSGRESWIRLDKVTGGKVSHNTASSIKYSDATVDKSGNILAAAASDTVATQASTWLSGQASLTGLSAKLDTMLVGKVALLGVLDTATAQTAQTVFQETVMAGTAGEDRLAGGAIGDFRLNGGAGNDTLTGGTGTGCTTMVGGLGDDTYIVKSATHIVVEDASAGTDTVSAYVDYTLTANVENLRVMGTGLTVYGNELGNGMTGGAGDDTIHGLGGNDTLVGGAGNDRLYGGAGADTLRGDLGNDFLYGVDGDDLLGGGDGDDLLDGGAGSDKLEGGLGRDRLVGGDGADTFIYRNGDFAPGVAASTDTIADFSRAQGDKISLTLVDAKSATTVDDGFRFIGSDGFHKIAGELRYEVIGGDSHVMGDTNGDGIADFNIVVAGVTTLAAMDFNL